MTKKITLLMMVLFLIFINVNAQTNDRIKEKSRENTKERNKSRDWSGFDGDIDISPEDIDPEACMDGCVGCFELAGLLDDIFVGLEKQNKKIKTRKDTIPRISSTELAMTVNPIPNDYMIFLPELRVNGGVLSTQIRLYYNKEEHFEENDDFSTFDWQVQFNLLVDKNLNIRLGSGIMYESYSGTLFNEHSFEFEIFPGKDFRISIEGRLAPDYKTETIVRSELNGSFYYPILRRDNKKVFAVFNAMSQNYYESVHVWTIGFGFSVLFE